MGLLESVGILAMWGVAVGVGFVFWRWMPDAEMAPRVPVRWAWVLGALVLTGVGGGAALLAGTAVGPVLARAVSGADGPLLMTSPVDGLEMAATSTLWLLHLLVAPPLATALAWVWAPRWVGTAVVLGLALMTGFVLGGCLAMPLVSGILHAVPTVDGMAATGLRAVDLLGAFVTGALVLGYGIAAAFGVAVVSSTTSMAWRRCALASAGWGPFVAVSAGVLTPPDLMTFILAAGWMSCGWGLGLLTGGVVVWVRGRFL